MIIKTLEQNGFEAYVVGGCVRDSLIGLNPNDWDICTSAKPEQTKECFHEYHIIETGMQHGTITIMIDHEPYEVTTYRIDGEYLDNRHPNEVQFVNSLKEDLARRDFTINAMAYNPKDELIDYFGGQLDLQNKVIQCVGNSDARFNEDALRIMRALRFASTYDFKIDDATKLSIHRFKSLLTNIADERINSELCKLLCGSGVKYILTHYHDVIGVFIPEILAMAGFEQNNPHHMYNVWEHTVNAIYHASNDTIIRIAVLFHDIGKPHCYTQDEQGIGHFYGHGQISSDMSYDIMKRLKFDNDTVNQVKELVLYHDADIQPRNKHIKRWLNKIGEERLRQLIEVKIADISAQSQLEREERLLLLLEIKACIDEVISQQQCFCLKDLAINGRDLIEIGIHQGTQIGVILNKLMDLVIEEQISNDKDELIEVAILIKKDTNQT